MRRKINISETEQKMNIMKPDENEHQETVGTLKDEQS